MPSYQASEPQIRPDCVEPGDYTVEVINAEETISKQGNEMIELKLKVLPSGAILYDNLVFTKNAFWKIDAFRAATGEKVIPDEEVDLQPDDLIGRTGRARLVIEEYNQTKRNKVTAWLLPKVNAAPAQEGGLDDDNIPF
jgi:hypothetical protein